MNWMISHFIVVYIRFNGRHELYSSIYLFLSSLIGIWSLFLLFSVNCLVGNSEIGASWLMIAYFLPFVFLSWLPKYLRRKKYGQIPNENMNLWRSLAYITSIYVASTVLAVSAGAICT